jgi:predicted SprT family Zn-dependent metalloprotease
MIIKWARLRKICRNLSGSNISLLLSTELDEHVNAALSDNTIALNGMKLKEDVDIIKAIAHEMVHVIYPKIEHGQDFDFKWLVIEKYITDKYKNN